MGSRTDPAWRWQQRRNGLYSSPSAQLGYGELLAYADNLAAVVGGLGAGRAAWHMRDLILNAGERGGAAEHLDVLRALRAAAGGPSWHGRPHRLGDTWTATLYRGGEQPAAPSWTTSQRVAVSYADSDSRGRQRPARAPLWRLTAEPDDVLAVVPVALAGDPSEFVLDPAGITADRLVEIPEDEQPEPLPRRGGRTVWTAVR